MTIKWSPQMVQECIQKRKFSHEVAQAETPKPTDLETLKGMLLKA